MKTIEEEAREYASKDFPNKSSFEFHNQYTSFKAGLELAQRWIPVEEEPEDGQKILLKYKDTELSAVYHRAVKIVRIQSFGGDERKYMSFNIFESWRPINRK